MYKFGEKVYCVPDLIYEVEPIEGTITTNCDFQRDDDISVQRTSDKYKIIVPSRVDIFFSRESCEKAIQLKLQLKAIMEEDIALRNASKRKK